MKKFFQRIIHFFKYDLWNKDTDNYDSKAMSITAKQLRVFIFTIKGYGKHDLTVRSGALTYYTLWALVPAAAIIFSIAKGFSFEEKMQEILLNAFPNNHALIIQVEDFATRMIEQTKGGVLAITGIIVLLWAVIKVFIHVENSFNHIWEIHKERSITRKVSDYLLVLLVAPIFWFVTNNASEVIGSKIHSVVDGTIFEDFVNFLGMFVPLIVICIMLTVVYYVMPNTKVKFKPAVTAAVIAGVALNIFQIAYFFSQSKISNYNAIYGTFAALPLFLAWLSVSWQIIMFGAELSFGYQNIERYEMERESGEISNNYRRMITLLVMHKIAVNFHCSEPPMDDEQLAASMNLSVRIVRDVLFDLEHAGLITQVEDDNKKSAFYLPMKDVSKLRIYDVIQSIDDAGVKSFKGEEDKDLKYLNNVMSSITSEFENSDKNILLMDIGPTGRK